MSIFLGFILAFSPVLYAVSGFEAADFQHCQEKGANFEVIVKNVGQGSCTILKNHRNARYVIIDAGTSSDTPEEIVNRIAGTLGIGEVHSDLPEYAGKITAITSHSDKDHINIFAELFSLNTILFQRTTQFILGDSDQSYLSKQDGKELHEGVLQRIPAVVSFINEYRKDWLLDSEFLDAQSLMNPNTFLSILFVNAGAGSSYAGNENTNSAVVRLSLNGHNVLIMGDASAIATRRYLVDRKKEIPTAVYQHPPKSVQLSIVSHHGAKDEDGSNDGFWLNQKQPRHVAISAGYRYNGHPDLGLFQEFFLIDCLRDTTDDFFHYEDSHPIAIGVSNPEDYEYAKGQLAPDFRFIDVDTTEKWSIFATKKSIYNTANSGDLRYIFDVDGSLISFSREY